MSSVMSSVHDQLLGLEALRKNDTIYITGINDALNIERETNRRLLLELKQVGDRLELMEKRFGPSGVMRALSDDGLDDPENNT